MAAIFVFPYKQFIYDYTGLSEKVIDKLQSRITYSNFSPILNMLISMDTFEYTLFHISEYVKNLSRQKEIEPYYHTELKQLYSDQNDGNYLGEGTFEKEYHELERDIEHQEFQINKYFLRTISIISENIEKAPDTN